VLETLDLARRYGQTLALDGVSLRFQPGSIHAVLGENGSGKSTLVKLLAGIVPPSAGEIRIDGAPVRRFAPARMQALGLATVFQEVLVAPDRSVTDNILLGLDGLVRRHVPRSERRQLAARVLAEIARTPVDPDAPAGALPLAARQLVVLARALARSPRILILDEATAALDFADREAVFRRMERFAAAGGLILFISHRMDEVTRLADRVSVLRSGRLVATLERAEAQPGRLLALMAPEAGRNSRMPPDAALLRIEDVALRPDAPAHRDALQAGEILGLAGLDGHGQEAFLEVLAGLRRPAQGRIVLAAPDGDGIALAGFRQAVAHGIAYLPRDRRATGLFPSLSVLDNFGIVSFAADRRFGLIDRRRRRRRYEHWRERLSIVAPGPDAPVTSLSGGNQQKLLLARWLARAPRILLLNDPTRGVDQRTRETLYGVFRDLARHEGLGLVVLSTEIEEVVRLCRRVLVFREQHVAAALAGEAMTADAVIAAMFGQG